MNDDDDLITIKAACAILGGSESPLDRSTYYKGAREGRFPKPIHPVPGCSRLSKRKILELRQRLLDRGESTGVA